MKETDDKTAQFTDACHLLFDRDTPEQKAQGLSLLKRLAEQNDLSARCLLGDFYLYGKKGLVEKNISKSTSCYFQAWDMISSQFAGDDDESLYWYHVANICLRMGTVFLYGRCQVEDYDLAEMFFWKACYEYMGLVGSDISGVEKKLSKARNLLFSAQSRKRQLTAPIYIYDKATLKAKPFTVYPFHAVHRSIMTVYDHDINRFLCEKVNIPYIGEPESYFYCYADETCGLTLRALGFFNHSNHSGKGPAYQIIPESQVILFRYSSFSNWNVSLGEIPPFVYQNHRELCQTLMETYEANPTIMKRCLDPLRSAEFPYDI